VGCARPAAIEIIANAAQRGAHAAANEVPLAREKKEIIKKSKKRRRERKANKIVENKISPIYRPYISVGHL